MATTKRDYYEVLSVSRDADGHEIKKSYRRLAMEYHPDRNPGDKQAEERFKELAEAYEVLASDEKRQLYDRHGHAGPERAGFQGFGGVEDILSHFADLFGGAFGGRGGGQSDGADIETEVRVTLAEAAVGTQKELTYDHLIACTHCQGSGAKPGTQPTACGTCGGRGQVAHNQGIFMIATTCPTCRGRGALVKEKCEECRGAGVERKRESLSVNVPAGIDDGQTLRHPGKGQAAQGGRPGHLYVHIRVEADPRFERAGDDLITDVPLTFAQAALGATVTVPLIDGDPVAYDVKPGTQPGTVAVLRGKGMPNVHGRGKGDLGVRLLVRVPEKLSAEQKKLVEELGKLDPAQPAPPPRAADDEERGGFFFGRKKKKR
jgi:molecular chaperone DnaJ